MDKFIYEVIGFFCGFMLIFLTSGTSIIEIPQLLTSFIINPFLFFILMICFFIGFLAHSVLFKGAIETFYHMAKGNRFSFMELIFPISLVGGYFILFIYGPWQTFLLIAFSIIYGIITVDLPSYSQSSNSE
jgi:hypothetical protein